MPETIVLPPEDIRDFVAIQHDADGKIRVKVVEAKKHITSVQRYLTLLRSRYPGKISKFDFTTLDVIAALNSNNAENVGLGFKPKGGDENSRFKLNGAQNITWSQSQIADGMDLSAFFRRASTSLTPTPGDFQAKATFTFTYE